MSKIERVRDILDPIAHQLQTPQELDRVLYQIAREAAEYFEAVCCRVWLVRRGDLCSSCNWANQCSDRRRCLHLKASCGASIENEYRRAPLDVFSHETIARGGIADWSRHAPEFNILINREWAETQGLVSFATHPLRVENRVVGLIAVFSRKLIYPADYREMTVFAAYASTAIRVAELAVRVARSETTLQEKGRELQQTSWLLNAVLNGPTEQAIVVEDLEGNILAFNEGAQRMYGYAPHEVVGKSNSEKLYAPQDRAAGRTMDVFRVALEQGRHEAVFHRMRKNGELFLEKAVLTLQRDEEGDPAGFVLVARDLSRESAPTQVTLAQSQIVDAFEGVFETRRMDLVPAAILRQMAGLLPTQEGIIFLCEGKYLVVRGVYGYESNEGLVGIRFSESEAEELHRSIHQKSPREVTDDILPGYSPLVAGSRVAHLTPRWIFPLSLDGALGGILLAPPSGTRYGESDLALGKRFIALAVHALDQALFIEQVNEQLRLVQARYSALEHDHRALCDQSADLQLSRAQLLEKSGNVEADLVRLTGRHQQLIQESAELQAYVSDLEESLRTFKQKSVAAIQQIEAMQATVERVPELERSFTVLEQTNLQLRQNLTEAERHYEQGFRRVSERNAQLEKMLKDLQQEQHERDAKLKVLEEQNAVREQLQASHTALEAERAAWQVTRDRLERELRESELHREAQTNQIRGLEMSLSHALEQRNEARHELERLKQETAKTNSTLESMNSTTTQLQTQLVEQEQENQQLRAQLLGVKEHLTLRETETAQLQTTKNELEERLRRLTVDIKQQQDEITGLQQTVISLREVQVTCLRLEQRERTLEERLNSLRSEYELAESERLRIARELQETRELAAFQQAESLALREGLEADFDAERILLQERVQALTAEVLELEDIRDEHRELAAAHGRLNNAVALSQEELSNALAALEMVMNELRNTEQEMTALAAEMENLRTAHATDQSTITALKAELEALRAIPPVDTAAYEARIADLESLLSEHEENENEQQRIIMHFEDEVARLGQEKYELRQQSEALSKRVTELTEKLETQRQEKDDLATELEVLKNLPPPDFSPYEVRISGLQNNLQVKEEDLARLEREVAYLDQELSRQSVTTNDLRQELQNVQERAGELLKVIAERERMVSELQTELDALRAIPPVDVAGFEGRITELEVALDEERFAAEKREQEAEILRQEIAERQAELDALRAIPPVDVAGFEGRITELEVALDEERFAAEKREQEAEILRQEIAERQAELDALRAIPPVDVAGFEGRITELEVALDEERFA
ncbi:MAG: PAS domain S-box protein, partial [Blastocatellia bacterium]|nr:PAS domain S-box protein [Blastocatellia bacterium]